MKSSFIKGGMLSFTRIQVSQVTLESIRQDVEERVSKHPDFFKGMPVVLVLDQLENEALPSSETLSSLIQSFNNIGLKVLAISADEEASDLAQDCHLPLIKPLSPSHRERLQSSSAEQAQAVQETQSGQEGDSGVASQDETFKSPLIINKSVRSGQQVYAKDRDLIVKGFVGFGAEVAADGNIHIYGALKGRALAGAHGHTEARIFCQSLEAELLSISGNYTMMDSLKENELWKSPCEVSLNDDEDISIRKL